MRLAKKTPYESTLIDRRAGEKLEQFCRWVSNTFDAPEKRKDFRLDAIAAAFRTFFHLPVPLPAAVLFAKLEEMGIIVDGDSHMEVEGHNDYDEEKKQYIIRVPYPCNDEVAILLHEVFEIIAGRLFFLSSWWGDWCYQNKVEQAHQVADEFAGIVLVPPRELRIQSQKNGRAVFAMAKYFNVPPALITKRLSQVVRVPCPVFTARLSLTDLTTEQGILMLDDPAVSVRAKVWRAELNKPKVETQPEWGAIETLKKVFPKKNRILSIDGFALQALKEGREISCETDNIFNIRLPYPVFVVARPNGISRTQLYIHAVPRGYEDQLLDEALRAARNQAENSKSLLGMVFDVFGGELITKTQVHSRQ